MGFLTYNNLSIVIDILQPITFAFLFIGAMLPYAFTAFTMKSVGQAAFAMVVEVERQFTADPTLMDPNSSSKPDYKKCIQISTDASLREMILPGLLVILSPIFTGIFFGVEGVCVCWWEVSPQVCSWPSHSPMLGVHGTMPRSMLSRAMCCSTQAGMTRVNSWRESPK